MVFSHSSLKGQRYTLHNSQPNHSLLFLPFPQCFLSFFNKKQSQKTIFGEFPWCHLIKSQRYNSHTVTYYQIVSPLLTSLYPLCLCNLISFNLISLLPWASVHVASAAKSFFSTSLTWTIHCLTGWGKGKSGPQLTDAHSPSFPCNTFLLSDSLLNVC